MTRTNESGSSTRSSADDRGGSQARALQRPHASWALVLGSTSLLLVLGVVMVFSASSVRAYATYGASWAIAAKQAAFIAAGLVAMVGGSRVPVAVWRRLGAPLLVVSAVLLVAVLVPDVGKEVDGSTRWIPLPGGINLQPSELAKLGLVLWGADLLARKERLLVEWRHLLVPLVPVTALLALLVMLQPDMGTTMCIVAVMVALLWVVGTPLRLFALMVGVLAVLASVMAVVEPYRMRRVTSFVDPFADPLGDGYQAVQGFYALSSGGWFGVGLGASSEKWEGILPNAHTDFVFAIIGEELGLLGTMAVLVLFAAFAYAGTRTAQRAGDSFTRLAAAAITVWLVAQAVINLGAVVGLLPITGIPLPFISFGGSAMVTNLLAVGALLAFARAEPGAAEALAARRTQRRRRRTAARTAAAPPRPVPAPRRAPAASGARRP